MRFETARTGELAVGLFELILAQALDDDGQAEPEVASNQLEIESLLGLLQLSIGARKLGLAQFLGRADLATGEDRPGHQQRAARAVEVVVVGVDSDRQRTQVQVLATVDLGCIQREIGIAQGLGRLDLELLAADVGFSRLELVGLGMQRDVRIVETQVFAAARRRSPATQHAGRDDELQQAPPLADAREPRQD